MRAGSLKERHGAEDMHVGPLALAGWVIFDWSTQPFYTLVVTFLFAP